MSSSLEAQRSPSQLKTGGCTAAALCDSQGALQAAPHAARGETSRGYCCWPDFTESGCTFATGSLPKPPEKAADGLQGGVCASVHAVAAGGLDQGAADRLQERVYVGEKP